MGSFRPYHFQTTDQSPRQRSLKTSTRFPWTREPSHGAPGGHGPLLLSFPCPCSAPVLWAPERCSVGPAGTTASPPLCPAGKNSLDSSPQINPGDGFSRCTHLRKGGAGVRMTLPGRKSRPSRVCLQTQHRCQLTRASPPRLFLNIVLFLLLRVTSCAPSSLAFTLKP